MGPTKSNAAEAVLETLIRHRLALQGYALAITADHQLAEDAFQEVAALATSDPSRVPIGAGSLPWLREATRRKALERARRARRGDVTLSSDVVDQLATAFELDDDGSDARSAALSRCMQKLPDAHRLLLDARYRENLSAEELAKRAGRSVQGVYALMKRLRSALALCVRRQMPGGAVDPEVNG